MPVRIQREPFDSGAEVELLSAASEGVGAVVSFVGQVRSHDPDTPVLALELEHYPGMTERAIADIVARARLRWPLLGVRVVHRVGRLVSGEPIVFVGTASAHRGDAFAACEFIMDYLKTQAPLWKKETTAKGTHWVEARLSDDAAAARWTAPSSGSELRDGHV